jgi:hypothetical protein
LQSVDILTKILTQLRLDNHHLALLLVVLLADVQTEHTGTALAAGSAAEMARRLAAAPEGLNTRDQVVARDIGGQCPTVFSTGRAGDVFVLHPWTVHCAANAMKGQLRVLANPSLRAREPIYRDGRPRSPVEAIIHDAIG